VATRRADLRYITRLALPFLTTTCIDRKMESSSLSAATTAKISSLRIYFEWEGYPISDLTTFRDITLAERPDKPVIYLAGDSSLDNKYWVDRSGTSVAGVLPDIYHKTLNNPAPSPDVAFWMNHLLEDRATCINTAVEETMLRDRDDTLLSHDKFIRDNIRPSDIVIVSVGANDVALRPNNSTIRHMLQLAWLTSRSSLEDHSVSSLTCFKELFCTKIQNYIIRLTEKNETSGCDRMHDLLPPRSRPRPNKLGRHTAPSTRLQLLSWATAGDHQGYV
jgi:hypothetical protein